MEDSTAHKGRLREFTSSKMRAHVEVGQESGDVGDELVLGVPLAVDQLDIRLADIFNAIVDQVRERLFLPG